MGVQWGALIGFIHVSGTWACSEMFLVHGNCTATATAGQLVQPRSNLPTQESLNFWEKVAWFQWSERSWKYYRHFQNWIDIYLNLKVLDGSLHPRARDLLNDWARPCLASKFVLVMHSIGKFNYRYQFCVHVHHKYIYIYIDIDWEIWYIYIYTHMFYHVFWI